ncbi:MAG: acyl-CoA dehydrogenase family protein [Dehalococcoidia bacterium]|nr:acyl-CoA dehydrogenase family protein [Dehalococcoidia bacterium]
MDFRFSKAELYFRNEVDEFIRAEMPAGYLDRNYNWPCAYGALQEAEEPFPEADSFLNKMKEKGYLFMAWPKEYGGRDASYMDQAILAERLGYHRAPSRDQSTTIIGPTILRHGSEEYKKEWIPRIMQGARFWLAYSEPNAGSDLAGIQTTAAEDGDYLVVNGQKIWSSGAHVWEYGWMIARTDRNRPAHKGSSLFIVETNSPGVTIRPLINIAGFHSFNEVFFDNVRVPKKNIVGEKNMGFYYLMTALDYERIGLMSVGGLRGTFEEIIEYARSTIRNGKPISSDPLLKNKMAAIATEIEIAEMYYFKTAWMMDNNLFPNIEASAFKLMATELSRKLADLAMEIAGMSGQIFDKDGKATLVGRIGVGYLDAVSATIGAGTSEIMRNIIAQRGLGLPRRQ